MADHIFDVCSFNRHCSNPNVLDQFFYRLDEKKFDERVYSALARVEERILKDDEDRYDLSIINAGKNRGKTPLGKDASSITMDPWKKKNHHYELRSMQEYGKEALDRRIEPKKIGTYLEQELKTRGIDLEYNYGVFDYESEAFIVINDHYSVQIGESDMMSNADSEAQLNQTLVDSRYKVDLFKTHDGAAGALKVQFPRKQRWLWGSVWP